MNDISAEARALLRAARDEFEASSEDCARIDRALTTRLGLAAGAIVGATTATTVSAATAGATGTAVAGASGATVAIAAKWVAAALLLAAVGAGGGSMYRSSNHAPAASTARSVEAPPHALATAAATAMPSPNIVSLSSSSDPSGTEHVPVPIASLAVPRAPTPFALQGPTKAAAARLSEASDPTLGAETQLLRRADQALRIGDPARALELLDEHARTFPDGVLAEERSAERVTTLCTLGRVNQARSEAARFLAIHADSPLAKVVRGSCGGVEPGNGPAVP
jgi:RNA polymerase sigma-70 factor (ECF subfamily)